MKTKEPTLQLQIKAWMESLGYKEIPSPSNKYICMHRYNPKILPDRQRFYFLGKSGGFRSSIGKKPVTTQSFGAKPNQEKFDAFRKAQGWLI